MQASILLLIKGTVADACVALAAHGIAPSDCIRPPTIGDLDECSAEVRLECEPRVARWYCEPGESPFPPGTLLYYKSNEER